MEYSRFGVYILIDATANSGWSICCKIFESLTEKNRKWFTYQYYNIEPNSCAHRKIKWKSCYLLPLNHAKISLNK
jgi:hypothetical protein